MEHDHDTPAFAVASIRHWWRQLGRARAWKLELQRFADETRLRIHVSHFPPGTSKWNKIEHRLFCHITENWRGTPLRTFETIVDRIGNRYRAARLCLDGGCASGVRTSRRDRARHTSCGTDGARAVVCRGGCGCGGALVRAPAGAAATQSLEELQADEIRSFVGGKTRPTWIFVAIEVWSRLWPSTVTGRRSYRNTLALLRDIANRVEFKRLPLIVTGGFDFYEKVVRRVFGPAVLYGQVLKTRRHDRIVQVERRARMGAAWRFEEALTNSEDSSTLNTSFIERMNLTIRQGSAYLSRRTLFHARSEAKLEQHLELLRCHYNFVRPHGGLKFGGETRTPAMQAGLAARRLTFREVFVGQPPSLLVLVSIGAITCAVPSRLPTAPVGDELLAA